MSRIRLSMKKLNGKNYRVLAEYLDKVLGVNYGRYLKSSLYVTCFDKLCIIHEGCGRLGKATLIYSGAWIGVLVRKRPYLSPLIYEDIYRETGFKAAIKVGEKAVKNFLYGRDVLVESVLEQYPPLSNPVAVLDQEYRVIGVAEPLDRVRGVYRNVYDLGIFLRLFEK